MNEEIYYGFSLLTLILAELLFLTVAKKVNLIDKPNVRSSHEKPTIRGGGIIFFAAFLLWFVYFGWQHHGLLLGITMIAGISVLDDIRPRPAAYRLLFQTMAIAILFYELSLYSWPLTFIGAAMIVCIGALNAFNFMDGINGITGIYALINLGTFWYVHKYVNPFTDVALIHFQVMAVLIFLYFNFREKAICFAGDVGAVTLAFIQIVFLLQLIYATDNFYWVVMFLVFGMDSVVTIITRLTKKENIFKPHRTHLYQFLSNEMGHSHQKISLLYGLLQLALNAILIWSFVNDKIEWSLIASVIVVLLYLTSRFYVIKLIAKKDYSTKRADLA